MTGKEFELGDRVRAHDGEIGTVVAWPTDEELDYGATPVVWDRNNYVALALTRYLTLVSRPSQSGRMEEVAHALFDLAKARALALMAESRSASAKARELEDAINLLRKTFCTEED